MSYPINLHPTNFQWGWYGNAVSGTSTNLAIAANKYYSLNFVCQEDTIPDEVSIAVDGATGVALTAEIWEVNNDTSCKPYAKVVDSSTSAAQTPTGAGTVTFTGLKGTSNNVYFGKTLAVVIKAGAGTPSGNIFNGPTTMNIGNAPQNIRNGGYSSSTDSGSTWATLAGGYQFAQVKWLSGNISWPLIASITTLSSTDDIYGSTFVDLVTLSPNAWISVNGIMHGALRQSSSASMPDLDVSLLANGSVVTTKTILKELVNTTWSGGPGSMASANFFLSNPVLIPPLSEVRIRLQANQSTGTPAGGSATYSYGVAKLNLSAGVPYGLIPGLTRYALNGTVDMAVMGQGALIFNLTDPFPAPPINRRNSMIQR